MANVCERVVRLRLSIRLVTYGVYSLRGALQFPTFCPVAHTRQRPWFSMFTSFATTLPSTAYNLTPPRRCSRPSEWLSIPHLQVHGAAAISLFASLQRLRTCMKLCPGAAVNYSPSFFSGLPIVDCFRTLFFFLLYGADALNYCTNYNKRKSCIRTTTSLRFAFPILLWSTSIYL